MDCADFPRNVRERSSDQIEIEGIVAGLITKRGYRSVMQNLLAAVYNLAEISLADPGNSTKQRDFILWVQAVRAAIQRHSIESAFEFLISDSDRSLARDMGIRLD